MTQVKGADGNIRPQFVRELQTIYDKYTKIYGKKRQAVFTK